MKLLALLKVKALVIAIASVALVGGATAAFAATPAGQTVVQSIMHARPTMTAHATPGSQADGHTTTATAGQHACPGLSDAQNLAVSYHLSTDSNGSALQAICALHQGTFKGTATSGTTVSASRVYGYGEVDQLLTYAAYLAAHDSGNMGGALTDANVSSYLADALQRCGNTPLQRCLQTNIPGSQSGHKPTTTPTPNGHKPTTTPTPNGHKPTTTPTPHH